jgi:hypothetical protein
MVISIMRVGLLCYDCKHYREDLGSPPLRPIESERPDHPHLEYCGAYPDGEGIPFNVLMMGHFRPKPGDHGIQFEPKDGVDEKRVARLREIHSHEDDIYEPPGVLMPNGEFLRMHA